MPKKVIFTPQTQKYILDNRLKVSGNKMEKVLGISRTAIKTFLKDKDLLLTAEETKALKSASGKEKTTFTPKEDKYIKENYLTMPIKRIAKQLNRSFCGVMGRLNHYNLTIPDDIMQQRKQHGRFIPGQVPFSKGKKQSDFTSPEGIERSKATRFKKGQVPRNIAEADGVVRIRKMVGGRQYKWIRMSPGCWKMLHIHIWEQHNGPVPEGFVISFKDNDSLNAVVGNLEAITPADHMKKHTIHNYPEDLKEIMFLKGALNRTISRTIKKQTENERHD